MVLGGLPEALCIGLIVFEGRMRDFIERGLLCLGHGARIPKRGTRGRSGPSPTSEMTA